MKSELQYSEGKLKMKLNLESKLELLRRGRLGLQNSINFALVDDLTPNKARNEFTTDDGKIVTIRFSNLGMFNTPINITKFQDLRMVYIKNCKVKKLGNLFDLPKLKYLSLNNINLKELSEVTTGSEIPLFLHINGSKVGMLDSLFNSLPTTTQSISISNSKIEEITFNKDVRSEVSELRLSNIIISKSEVVDFIHKFPNLTVLKLTNLNLEDLPHEIQNLKSLKRIDIRGNNLSKLPEFLFSINNLKEIRTENFVLRNTPNYDSLPDYIQIYTSSEEYSDHLKSQINRRRSD